MKTCAPLELLQRTLEFFLQHPENGAAAAARFGAAVPQGQQLNVNTILSSPAQSYREALIIQLAYGLASDTPLDLTVRHKGARGSTGVAGRLSQLLSARHIACTKDAYQNIGKNTANLARGNFEAWDSFLRWASAPDTARQQLEAAFEHACVVIASTARPVAAMPTLNIGSLTFTAVSALFDGLFAEGSQGAYEQFTVAALI